MPDLEFIRIADLATELGVRGDDVIATLIDLGHTINVGPAGQEHGIPSETADQVRRQLATQLGGTGCGSTSPGGRNVCSNHKQTRGGPLCVDVANGVSWATA